MSENDYPKVGGRSAKIALVLLVIVYIFKFVDRQILIIIQELLYHQINQEHNLLIGIVYLIIFLEDLLLS